MQIIRSISSLRRAIEGARGKRILVPTMGALHQGHAALIRRARQRAGKSGSVAVSIFVNPTQFGPGEDFTRYPRHWTRDRDLCRKLGVDLIFAPPTEVIYQPDHSCYVEETAVSERYCGASRPGHFRGVSTVVCQLFHLLQPTEALFGEKDYQQLCVIRRMVRDLHLPVKIVGCPTVREEDGLAMSSRNAYLSPGERAAAPNLYRGLTMARQCFSEGITAPGRLKQAARRPIRKIPGLRLEYLELVDPETLEPVRRAAPESRMLLAARLGSTRLIDNIAMS